MTDTLETRLAAKQRRRDAKRDERARLHPIHGQALRSSAAIPLRPGRATLLKLMQRSRGISSRCSWQMAGRGLMLDA